MKGADESEKNESKVESTEVEAAVSAAQTRAEMGASITSKMKTVFPGSVCIIPQPFLLSVHNSSSQSHD